MKLSAMLTSALTVLLACDHIRSGSGRTDRLLVLLGDDSFGIYLSHMAVIPALERLPFYAAIPFGLNSALILLLSLGGVQAVRTLCGSRIGKWLGLE